MSVVVARLVMQFAPLGQLVCNLMKKGFLYPVVDKEKCVKCNACIKVCMFNKDIRLMTDK